MQSLRYVLWAGVPLTLGLGQPVLAQDGSDEIAPAEGVPQRCITLNRVQRTEVIDDRTLIFHMRGGDEIYLNYLERECPGLKREGRFMYSPTGNRLCNIDYITVLEQWGFGLTRGFTCSLGDFHPISAADLADLKRAEGGGVGGSGDFEVVPVDPADLEEVQTEDTREPADGDADGEAAQEDANDGP